MNRNAKRGLLESGPSSKSNAVVAEAIVPHASDTAQQGDALFPGNPGLPIARPLVLVTRGRIEFLGRCPNCQNMHRHTHLGKVTGPCGAKYELQPKAKLRGVA
jgi:hypothetical protein